MQPEDDPSIAPDPEQQEPEVPAMTLKQRKQMMLGQINLAAQAEVGMHTSAYPAFEIASWPDQQKEADAWVADKDAPTPVCDRVAVAREMDPLEFMARTVYKVNLFREIAADAAGKRQRLEDLIDHAETDAELDLIAW